jgi:AcrR family transcriptional regulator
MGSKAAAASDARTDRLLRSRGAICDACLDLVQEGVLQPSADQIAERAGLSRRSIFYHFKDLAELYDAVVAAGMERYAPAAEIPRTLAVAEPGGMLIGAVVRRNKVIMPASDLTIEAGDQVIAMVTYDALQEAEHLLGTPGAEESRDGVTAP